jgi:phage tail-like protein
MANGNEPPKKDDPAVSVCFALSVAHDKLGVFNTCEGLGLEVVIEQREEGGNNGFVWQLPTRIKYPNIKLSRSVGKDSAKLTAWVCSFANGVQRQTATISAMTLDGTVVATWTLDGVIPVRWSGPSLNPDSPKVAMETVELAHHGFLPPETG